MANQSTPCEYEGCEQDGFPCFLLDDEPDRPTHHYCCDHAPDEGFCGGCGRFIEGSGDRSFDRFGLCETCYGDLDEDDWVDDDWDDESDDFDDDRDEDGGETR